MIVFTRKLKQVLDEHIRKQIGRDGTPRARDRQVREIAVNHMLAALVGLIEWWLANDLKPPAEQMAVFYDRLIVQATWQALFDQPA